jgi:cytochrome c oxidase assembly protein subunit 15
MRTADCRSTKGGLSMNSFRRLAFLSTLATYFLIFMGGLVRVSGAGLGCPDWPRCYGRWIPPLSVGELPAGIDPTSLNVTLAWIEYINRLAGVTVGLLILATALVALVRFRSFPRILYPSLAAALLTAYQGWQGSRLVASGLEPLLVSIHLGLSFIIASLLIYVIRQASSQELVPADQTPQYPRNVSLLVILIWIGFIVQVALGTSVRAGFENAVKMYPLMSDAELLSVVGARFDVHMIFGVLVALCMWIIGLAVLNRAVRPTRLVRQIIIALMLLALVQIILGLILMIFGSSPVLQLFHLWVAGIIVGLVLGLLLALNHKGAAEASVGHALTRIVAPALGTVLVTAFVAFVVTSHAEASREQIPVLYPAPEFSFVEKSGQPFGLADLKNRISVVDFFFTNCHGPCPQMNAQMANLYALYSHSDKVQLVSFTVDPENDTPLKLTEYAQRFGVTDNRWRFVRGPLPEVSRLCEAGFKVSGDLPGLHSTKLILVDTRGMIRGYYDYDSEASLKLLQSNIRTLGREME